MGYHLSPLRVWVKGLIGGRYPSPIVDHILAVDMAVGTPRWRVARSPLFNELPSRVGDACTKGDDYGSDG